MEPPSLYIYSVCACVREYNQLILSVCNPTNESKNQVYIITVFKGLIFY